MQQRTCMVSAISLLDAEASVNEKAATQDLHTWHQRRKLPLSVIYDGPVQRSRCTLLRSFFNAGRAVMERTLPKCNGAH
jgi:hypothetical protein